VNYPLLNVFFTTMWFFLWVLWFFLLFRIIGDLFRDSTLGGWAKAGWAAFVIVLPFLGVLIYLVARGQGMAEREQERSKQSEEEVRAYIKDAAAGDGKGEPSDHVAELARLADLKNHGDITEEEYQRAKTMVLAA